MKCTFCFKGKYFNDIGTAFYRLPNYSELTD